MLVIMVSYLAGGPQRILWILLIGLAVSALAIIGVQTIIRSAASDRHVER